MSKFRILVQFSDSRPDAVMVASSFFEADYLADEVRAGKYWAQELVSRVRVQVECSEHGWADGSSGYCQPCYDAMIEAEEQEYYLRLNL